jgi:hypothetical protein
MFLFLNEMGGYPLSVKKIDDNVYRVKFKIEDKIGDKMDNLLETALR